MSAGAGVNFIQYRFSSDEKSPFREVYFQGNALTVLDMKRAIVEHNKDSITNVEQSNYSFENLQSGKKYTKDEMVIERNSRIIVKRIPATSGYNLALRLAETSQNAGTLTAAIGGASVPFVAPGFNPTPAQIGRTGPVSRLLPGEGAAPTKEELVKLAGIDSSMQTDEALALVQAGGGFGANRAPRDAQAQYLAKQEAYKHAPHESYRCKRCMLPGHWLKNCPTNGDSSFDLRPGDQPSPGLLASGVLATLQQQHQQQGGGAPGPDGTAGAPGGLGMYGLGGGRGGVPAAGKPKIVTTDLDPITGLPVGYDADADADADGGAPFRPGGAGAGVPGFSSSASSIAVAGIKPRFICAVCARLLDQPLVTPCCYGSACAACLAGALNRTGCCPCCSQPLQPGTAKAHSVLEGEMAEWRRGLSTDDTALAALRLTVTEIVALARQNQSQQQLQMQQQQRGGGGYNSGYQGNNYNSNYNNANPRTYGNNQNQGGFNSQSNPRFNNNPGYNNNRFNNNNNNNNPGFNNNNNRFQQQGGYQQRYNNNNTYGNNNYDSNDGNINNNNDASDFVASVPSADDVYNGANTDSSSSSGAGAGASAGTDGSVPAIAAAGADVSRSGSSGTDGAPAPADADNSYSGGGNYDGGNYDGDSDSGAAPGSGAGPSDHVGGPGAHGYPAGPGGAPAPAHGHGPAQGQFGGPPQQFQHRSELKCFHCGGSGHIARFCFQNPQNPNNKLHLMNRGGGVGGIGGGGVGGGGYNNYNNQQQPPHQHQHQQQQQQQQTGPGPQQQQQPYQQQGPGPQQGGAYGSNTNYNNRGPNNSYNNYPQGGYNNNQGPRNYNNPPPQQPGQGPRQGQGGFSNNYNNNYNNRPPQQQPYNNNYNDQGPRQPYHNNNSNRGPPPGAHGPQGQGPAHSHQGPAHGPAHGHSAHGHHHDDSRYVSERYSGGGNVGPPRDRGDRDRDYASSSSLGGNEGPRRTIVTNRGGNFSGPGNAN